jgi:WD40 repeat protein
MIAMKTRVIMASLLALACAGLSPAGGSPAAGFAGFRGGAPVWLDRIAGRHGASDRLGGLAVAPHLPSVYVAASSAGAFVVVAYDASTGAREWITRTAPSGGASAFAEAVAVSADGSRLFVTGDVELSIDTRRTWTVAYDTTDGAVLWASTLSGGRHDAAIPRRIAVSPDGTAVFVAGSRTGTHGVDDFWDYFTVRYSATSGAEAWHRRFDAPAHGADTAEGLGISPDGTRVFVTGTSQGSNRDLATVAYDAASGTQQWLSRDDSGGDDYASDLVVHPDGTRVFVAGTSRTARQKINIVAYDAKTGSQQRRATYRDGGAVVTDLAVSSDGRRLFATGTNGDDAVTVAYSGSLRRFLWAARYDGGHGLDVANAVTVSNDGTRVFVTGESADGGTTCFGEEQSTAYATVAYAAHNGTRRWAARYPGLRRGLPAALEVATSPNRSLVFVSGNSQTACRNSDVATIAYRD